MGVSSLGPLDVGCRASGEARSRLKGAWGGGLAPRAHWESNPSGDVVDAYGVYMA